MLSSRFFTIAAYPRVLMLHFRPQLRLEMINNVLRRFQSEVCGGMMRQIQTKRLLASAIDERHSCVSQRVGQIFAPAFPEAGRES